MRGLWPPEGTLRPRVDSEPMTVNRRALESAALAGQPKRQASDHQTMKPPMGQFSGPVEMTATYALSLIHAYPAK